MKSIAERFAEFIADRIKRHPNAPVCDFYIANNWLVDQPENDVKISKLFFGKPLNYEEMLKRKERIFTLAEVEQIAREVNELPPYVNFPNWLELKLKEWGKV